MENSRSKKILSKRIKVLIDPKVERQLIWYGASFGPGSELEVSRGKKRFIKLFK